MKKACLICLILCLLVMPVFALATPQSPEAQWPEIFSNEAYVVNMNTDEVLFHKNTNSDGREIASLTKVMIFVLTVENVEDLQTMIEVPVGTRYIVAQQGGSHASLEDGYSYSAMDLLYGLMLPSGCDAAEALAAYVSGGDYQKALDMMNAKARELGMENTVYYSVSGLEKDGKKNLSTEQDLYKLAKHVFYLPYFQQVVQTEYHEITGVKNGRITRHVVQNTNQLIGEYNGAEYYFPYSLGGKTGHSTGAGRCFISFAKKGDLLLAIVTQGVPRQHHYYHFADHLLLLDYVFENYTENITVDIGSTYKSMGIGQKMQLIPETSQPTKITWQSSDESVAEVNEYGIVTGKKLGQVKITATTQTGNLDYAYVSVGFYNGVDVKDSSGPADPEDEGTYGPLDWTLLKDYGVDFAVIRAGYATGNVPKADPSFVGSTEGALACGIHPVISFDSYAATVADARAEAEFLLQYLQENIPQHLDKLQLPVVYNLSNCMTTDKQTLVELALTFQAALKAQGLEVMVELKHNVFSAQQLQTFSDHGLKLYVIKRPYLPDYQTRMLATSGEETYPAHIWQYRSDAYFGSEGIAKRIILSAMYMDAFTIDTAHEIYDEGKFPEKPMLAVAGSYTYTAEDITAAITGFDPETMVIQGNVARDAGSYTATVYPKTQWRDGSADPVSVSWTIAKATPQLQKPQLQAPDGTYLQDIPLPQGFRWVNPEEKVDKNGDNRFWAVYTPADGENYLTVELELTVTVQPPEKPKPPQPTEPKPTETKPAQTEPTESATAPTQPAQSGSSAPAGSTPGVTGQTGSTTGGVSPPKQGDLGWKLVAVVAAAVVVCAILVLPKLRGKG